MLHGVCKGRGRGRERRESERGDAGGLEERGICSMNLRGWIDDPGHPGAPLDAPGHPSATVASC